MSDSELRAPKPLVDEYGNVHHIADELAPKLAEVMQSVLQISVPLIVEVGKGKNWDEAH